MHARQVIVANSLIPDARWAYTQFIGRKGRFTIRIHNKTIFTTRPHYVIKLINITREILKSKLIFPDNDATHVCIGNINIRDFDFDHISCLPPFVLRD